jgi:hypothetical protein
VAASSRFAVRTARYTGNASAGSWISRGRRLGRATQQQ